MKEIFKVKNLKKYYGQKDSITKALDGISFQVMKNEFIGIMGSSGSGKTTLLNCIATITKTTSGSIILNNENIENLKGKELSEYRGNKVGYLFQNFELIENLTAYENILLPIAIHNKIKTNCSNEIKKLAKYMEFEEVLNKFPTEMSNGQKQRVAAVRSLILNPNIVLADEPTGALDSKNAKLLMEKLSNVKKVENTTILMVTHDASAASYCDRILFLQDGKLFHELRKKIPEESTEQFFERILQFMSQLGGGSNNVL